MKTPKQLAHIKIMRAIAESLSDSPLALKGGTALLLGYGLDRFSDDLDFDATRKARLAPRVEEALSINVDSYSIKVAKDTDTVYRLKIHYSHKRTAGLLKLEVSYRNAFRDDDVVLVDGIRMYKIGRLIEQKLEAIQDRTKARDLYDVAFLAGRYASDFSSEARQQLQLIGSDLNALEERFLPAFEDDAVLTADNLPEVVLRVADALGKLQRDGAKMRGQGQHDAASESRFTSPKGNRPKVC